MKYKLHVARIVFLMVVCSCGMGTKNSFQSFEKADASQDAAHEMEQGNPLAAILILEKALANDADNYELISLLSAAYAQKHGVGLIDIALKLASSGNEDSSGSSLAESSGNVMTALWPVLPEANDENLEGVDYAVELLLSIPNASRTNADSFKLGLLSTVAASLQLKALDSNNDGKLSLQELFGLNAQNAEAILNALLGASEATASISGDETSAQAASQIGSIYGSIQASPGTSDEEKLQAYMSN